MCVSISRGDADERCGAGLIPEANWRGYRQKNVPSRHHDWGTAACERTRTITDGLFTFWASKLR